MAKDRPVPAVHETQLSRDLTEFDITMIGVGAMIGAGIFVLTGIAAGVTGPALMLAFALNGVLTLFTAMTYAELGSAIPEAGGGYLWVKDALGSENGFLAGWMSWFSHSVAGALYALGFGAFFVLLVDTLFGVHFGIPGVPFLSGEKVIGVAIALVFVYINFRGASETGLAGNIVTVAKVVVIGIFLLFGLWAMAQVWPAFLDKFIPFIPQVAGNPGPPSFSVLMAMGLTFIAFEGYEIIVQAGEEVKDPRRTIPRAVFKSLMIVVPIYVLVAIVAIGAVNPPGGEPTWQFLGEHHELGIMRAAENFIPFGLFILLAGGLLSTISALNATTYSSTRVSFAMGRDNVLPAAFAKVHPRTRTPHIALGATGALIIFMVVFLPIEQVAAAADIMFILLFLQVNYTLIRMRNEFGDRLEYGYKVPFFPLTPILGIVSLAVLGAFLYLLEPPAWHGALIWLAVGLFIFFAYARDRVRDVERPVVAYEEKAGARRARRILVPIADPTHIPTEMTIAAALARREDAEVIALNAVLIPQQLPLSEGAKYADDAEPVLDEIRAFADDHLPDVTVHTMAGVGHSASQVINNIADDEEVDYTVIGWKGELREGLIRGSVAQAVVTWCPSDVLVLKDRGLSESGVEEVLVSVAPGFHGTRAVKAAVELAEGFGARLRLLTVVTQDDGKPKYDAEELDAWLDAMAEAAREAGLRGDRVVVEAVEGDSVVDTLVHQAEGSDLLVVGATHDWAVRRVLLGSVPDRIADRAPVTTVMVKGAESRVESLWRRLVEALR